jgi:hypothetical protein
MPSRPSAWLAALGAALVAGTAPMRPMQGQTPARMPSGVAPPSAPGAARASPTRHRAARITPRTRFNVASLSKPTDRDAFRFADAYYDMTLTIHLAVARDGGGRVTGLRLTTSRVANLEFACVAERPTAIGRP